MLDVATQRNDVGLVKHLLRNGVVPGEMDESAFIPRIRRLLQAVREVYNNSPNPTQAQLNDTIGACNGPPKFVPQDFIALEHTITAPSGERKLTLTDFARQRMAELPKELQEIFDRLAAKAKERQALPEDQRPGPEDPDRFSFPVGMDEGGRLFTPPADAKEENGTGTDRH